MHWSVWLGVAIFGVIIGSFLNVAIFRGPALWGLIDDDRPRGTLAFPRSYCPACRTPIKRTHLVPLLGFALARGRCAACSAPISLRYPVVELLGSLAAVLALARFNLGVEALLAMLFAWTIIVLAFIDGETGYLPDVLTIPLLAGGIAFNTVDLFVPFPDALIGAAFGYGVFVVIEIAYRLIRGRDGLGRGDAKLLGAIGAWVGWQALPAVVFLGAVATLAGALVLNLAKGKGMRGEFALPFGPGLAAAGVAVLFLPFAAY